MAVTTAIAAVASTGYSIYKGEQQKKQQKKQLALQSQANEDARKQGGAAGTMLTGNMGIDPNQLNLGKSTLLGG